MFKLHKAVAGPYGCRTWQRRLKHEHSLALPCEKQLHETMGVEGGVHELWPGHKNGF